MRPPGTIDVPQPEDPEGAASAPPTCRACGEIIGVYEPIVVVDHGAARETSRTAEPDLLPGPERELYHRACYVPVPQRVQAGG